MNVLDLSSFSVFWLIELGERLMKKETEQSSRSFLSLSFVKEGEGKKQNREDNPRRRQKKTRQHYTTITETRTKTRTIIITQKQQ